MKLMTLFGTRPEIIRLSLIIKQLDRFCKHVIVHTGQNYDENLSDVFFRELGLRQPDVYLGVQASDFAEQVGQIITRASKVMGDVKPDRVMILGDTNSGLSAVVAARLGIPVFHLEAGNRCYDDRVPEEINRRIIDHCSTVLMPYTNRSRDNLLREGIASDRIFVIGNPIYEVLNTYAAQIETGQVLPRLGLEPQQYFLVTMHREENVDESSRLKSLLEGLERVGEKYQQPIVVSLHPRTRDKMRQYGFEARSENIRFLNPLGFFDFVALERNARCVLTDSGTVQEECCIFGVPNVTIRDVTERPETVECGSNILSGAHPEMIMQAVDIALDSSHEWTPPSEYVAPHVSARVGKIVLGYRHQPLRR
ncbi:MAG: non-hydrolyzing UDP-N-acetylglucosamine 2-epimerase [Nitrospiraceae bacterium]